MRAIACTALLLWVGTASGEMAEKAGEKEFLGCTKYPESKRFRWGIRGEVGVAELAASLGEISCQAIVVSPQVAQRGGKVTLQVPDLLTAAEVYRLFLSSLEVMGLTVEQAGKTLKVVDANRAKEVSKPLGVNEATPSGDQFVTRLIRLEHARPQEVADVLSRLKSKEGEVSVYAPSSALLVTDRAANLRRMELLLAVLDVPRTASSDRMFVLATHGQMPTELAATLEKVLNASRRTTPGPAPDPKAAAASDGPLADGVTAIVPVDAARLVVMVGNDTGWRRVLGIAARIDPAAPDESFGQSHVVYLMHTNAEEMAATLKDIGLTSRSGAAPAPTRSGGAPAASGGGSALGLQGEVRIGADKVSNAIVVFAGGADFQMVRDLIGKLDVPRRQVYVEATILDISVNKVRELGLTFHNGSAIDANGSGAIVSNQSSKGLNTLTLDAASVASAASGAGLLAGVIGSSFNVAGMTIPSFGVVLKALEFSKDVNVISRPHLLTMDNAKAVLSVGQTIPYAASTLGSTVNTGNVIQTFNRQEVALKIELTPHLNDSDSVRLELDGEISDVPEGQSGNLAGGPITNKRTIKTAIVVRDGETVVLGGLQKETQSETVEKIPFLGDIPVLGRLFQTKSKIRAKQDLLIVLTPYVIRGPEDLRRIFERKQRERQEFIERYTAFRDDSVYEANVDYRRKRGLLQEIHLTALEAERESTALHKAEKALRRPVQEGPIEERR